MCRLDFRTPDQMFEDLVRQWDTSRDTDKERVRLYLLREVSDQLTLKNLCRECPIVLGEVAPYDGLSQLSIELWACLNDLDRVGYNYNNEIHEVIQF